MFDPFIDCIEKMRQFFVEHWPCIKSRKLITAIESTNLKYWCNDFSIYACGKITLVHICLMGLSIYLYMSICVLFSKDLIEFYFFLPGWPGWCGCKWCRWQSYSSCSCLHRKWRGTISLIFVFWNKQNYMHCNILLFFRLLDWQQNKVE